MLGSHLRYVAINSRRCVPVQVAPVAVEGNGNLQPLCIAVEMPYLPRTIDSEFIAGPLPMKAVDDLASLIHHNRHSNAVAGNRRLQQKVLIGRERRQKPARAFPRDVRQGYLRKDKEPTRGDVAIHNRGEGHGEFFCRAENAGLRQNAIFSPTTLFN